MKGNGMEEELEDFEDLDDLEEDDVYIELDDDRRLELDELVDHTVVGLEVWETSLGDDENEPAVSAAERVFFDCDLFFEHNQALELYVAAVYPDPEADPVQGMDAIFEAVGKLADEDLELLEYGQADEEGGLALGFGKEGEVTIALVASAWQVSEWEAGDEDEDEDEDA